VVEEEAHPVHYHANWAVWIEGERVELSGWEYMEDVAACATDPSAIAPRARVHMHDGNHDVVHVHHDGVSWGHLLQNLGWGVGATMGSTWIRTDQGRLLEDGPAGRWSWIVNGLVVPAAADRIIRPGDRFLLSYGPESDEELLRERFPLVSSDAPEFDAGYDPGGCGGHAPATMGERLRRAFWF